MKDKKEFNIATILSDDSQFDNTPLKEPDLHFFSAELNRWLPTSEAHELLARKAWNVRVENNDYEGVFDLYDDKDIHLGCWFFDELLRADSLETISPTKIDFDWI